MADSGLLVSDDDTNGFQPLFASFFFFSLRAASKPTVCLDADETRRDEART